MATAVTYQGPPATAVTPALAEIRDGVQSMFAAARVLPPGWRVRDVRREGRASVLLDVGPEQGPGVLLEWHERGDDPIPAFLEGPRYAVGYRQGPNAWALDDADTPAELKSAVARACELLALPPRPVPLEEDPLSARHAREVAFTPERFRTWLDDFLPAGAELARGWRVHTVAPFGPGQMAVSFAHPEEGFRVQLDVRPRRSDLPAAGRTPSLDVLYRTPLGRRADEAREATHASLAAELVLRFQASERGVRFVPAPPPGAEALTRSGRAATLALPDVGREPGAGLPWDVRQALQEATDAGAVILRVCGRDPLRAPWIEELLELVRSAGFDELQLHTSLADLADATLAARVVEAMPARFRLVAPLQGASAAEHDAAVGSEGDLAALQAALGHLKPLLAMRSGGGVTLQTTLTPAILEQGLAGIAALARSLGVAWQVRLAEPPPRTPVKRYREQVVSMTDAVMAVYPQDAWALAALPAQQVVPCVALAHQRRSGHPLLTAATVTARLRALELEPVEGPRERCPAEVHCALARACPRSVPAVYADETGLGELQAVVAADIAELADADAIAAALGGEGA